MEIKKFGLTGGRLAGWTELRYVVFAGSSRRFAASCFYHEFNARFS